MIATITDTGIIVFDLYIQSPFDWIDSMRSTFPNSNWVVGCYDGYEDCLHHR